MAPSKNGPESEGPIELRTTMRTNNSNNNESNENSDGGDAYIDDKIHEAYDQDAMRGGNKKDGASDPSSKMGTAARKDGHQRLGSHADDDFEDRPDGSIGTTEVIEDIAGAGTGTGTGTGTGDEGDGVVYKVYKRRWFGLVQLTLLNIVVSWDVSQPPRSPSVKSALLLVPFSSEQARVATANAIQYNTIHAYTPTYVG